MQIKEIPHAAIAALHGASPKSAYTELGVITSYVLVFKKENQ
jgi:hypothetical protein